MKNRDYADRFAMRICLGGDDAAAAIGEMWDALQDEYNSEIHARHITTIPHADHLAVEFNHRKGRVIAEMMNRIAKREMINPDFFIQGYRLLRKAEEEAQHV